MHCIELHLCSNIMPPERVSHKELLDKWIKGKENNFTTIGDSRIYCNVCDKKFAATRKHHISQHLSSRGHISKVGGPASSTQRLLHFDNTTKKDESGFKEDLTELLVKANIPWHALQNPVFKEFIIKYTTKTAPDESTLRKAYLPKLYEKVSHRDTLVHIIIVL